MLLLPTGPAEAEPTTARWDRACKRAASRSQPAAALPCAAHRQPRWSYVGDQGFQGKTVSISLLLFRKATRGA